LQGFIIINHFLSAQIQEAAKFTYFSRLQVLENLQNINNMLYIYIFCLANNALVYLNTAFAYQWKQIQCIRKSVSTNITDCHAAIAMIPTGELPVDPQPHTLGNPNRFNLNVPDSARTRKFKLPAAFRSGNCAIYVFHEPHEHWPGRTEPIRFKFQAASAMYLTVWPDMRRAALRIVEGCREGNSLFGGIVHTAIRTRAGDLPYVIRVTTVPRTMEGDGSIFRYPSRNRLVDLNVYEAGGMAGTKTSKPLYGPWWRNPFDRNDLIYYMYQPRMGQGHV